MSLAAAKIDAQRVLLRTRPRAVLVCLLTLLFKLLFLAALSICIYSLTMLPSYEQVTNIYLKIVCYALFSLGGLCSVCLYALVSAALRRWFYKNASSPQPISAYFTRPTVKIAFKTAYLFWLRKLLTFGTVVGYLVPFLAGTAGFIYTLRMRGLPAFLFYFSLGFLAVLLTLGLFFGFAAIQKYTLLEGLLTENPQRGVIDTLAQSRKIIRPISFAAARTKLRFAPWAILCLLIFPLIYVMPYYCQSVGCITKAALDKNHLTVSSQKPIIFLHLAKTPA